MREIDAGASLTCGELSLNRGSAPENEIIHPYSFPHLLEDNVLFWRVKIINVFYRESLTGNSPFAFRGATSQLSYGIKGIEPRAHWLQSTMWFQTGHCSLTEEFISSYARWYGTNMKFISSFSNKAWLGGWMKRRWWPSQSDSTAVLCNPNDHSPQVNQWINKPSDTGINWILSNWRCLQISSCIYVEHRMF